MRLISADELARRALAEEDPESPWRAQDLGLVLVLEGCLDEARRVLEPSVAAIERVCGGRHRMTRDALHSLRTIGRDSAEAAAALEGLAGVLRRAGENERAARPRPGRGEIRSKHESGQGSANHMDRDGSGAGQHPTLPEEKAGR